MGVFVNQSGAETGLPTCAQETSFLVVQDDANKLRDSLGAVYDQGVVVDRLGVLVVRIGPLDFPESEASLEQAITVALER